MRVNIIAEAGVNHNGDILMAEKLIKEAARAGADYVKFQTFKADKLVDKSAKKAKYQEETTGEGGQYEPSTSQFPRGPGRCCGRSECE